MYLYVLFDHSPMSGLYFNIITCLRITLIIIVFDLYKTEINIKLVKRIFRHLTYNGMVLRHLFLYTHFNIKTLHHDLIGSKDCPFKFQIISA